MSSSEPPINGRSKVKVVVRVRPQNDREKKAKTGACVQTNTRGKTVTVVKGAGGKATQTTYKFDAVFGTFASQKEVYDQTLAPTVNDVLAGYQTCIFAYGQTGTGKTYTVIGEEGQQRGIIPRFVEEV